MDIDKLKATLGKIHPDRELLVQVKACSAKKERPEPNRRRKLYQAAYAVALVCVLAVSAGIYGAYMGKAPGGEPDIARTSDGTTAHSGSMMPYSVREQETLVYDGRTIILLDECSEEVCGMIIRYPEEGTVCYTQDSFFLASYYAELFRNIFGEDHAQTHKAAVLVYREGEWSGKLFEPLEGEKQDASVIPAAYLEEIMNLLKEIQ